MLATKWASTANAPLVFVVAGWHIDRPILLIMMRIPIAVSLLILTVVVLRPAAASGGILTGRVIERQISDDGFRWTIGWPGTDRPGTFRREWPISLVTVRACSVDRVLETRADKDGRFRFIDVPSGTYDVVAAGRNMAPVAMSGVSVGNTELGPITIDITAPHAFALSPCYVDETEDCSTTRVSVNYDPPIRQPSAAVLGVVKGATQRSEEVLPGAKVVLSGVRGKKISAITHSDREGQFEFHVAPGYYQLAVSRAGFQPVQGKEFLVPRENATRVTIYTAEMGSLVVCQ